MQGAFQDAGIFITGIKFHVGLHQPAGGGTDVAQRAKVTGRGKRIEQISDQYNQDHTIYIGENVSQSLFERFHD